MKKIFLVTLFAVMSAFSAISSENNSNAMAPAEQQCVTVGNVSGNLNSDSGDTMKPKFTNHNNYPVNVNWEVYAYNGNGQRCIVASGTAYCSSRGDGGSTSYGYSFSTTGYSGFSLKMSVLKCD